MRLKGVFGCSSSSKRATLLGSFREELKHPQAQAAAFRKKHGTPSLTSLYTKTTRCINEDCDISKAFQTITNPVPYVSPTPASIRCLRALHSTQLDPISRAFTYFNNCAYHPSTSYPDQDYIQGPPPARS